MSNSIPPWQVTGLIFENCNCQLLCPGHISFKQHCTNARCHGYWAIHVDSGHFGDVDLCDVNAVIVFETPQRMYDGGWIQACYIDDQTNDSQRVALDHILSGHAGGPWRVLQRFVETRLKPRAVPMRFENAEREKRLIIPGLFRTTVTAIRGTDGQANAQITSLYNVIHGPTHVLARGHTRCTDGMFQFEHDKTHGLYSQFSWTASP